MPWPNFSESTFGNAFLSEFERQYAPGGRFPSAPEFISQHAEATLGYDVEVSLGNGFPVFFQFKRSFVLTKATAGEIVDGDFTETPLFRMYLRKHNFYSQHKILQEMDTDGNAVFYVTSQIENKSSLSAAYANGTFLSEASALFRPGEIALVDDVDVHYVTFQASANFGYVYSSTGVRFERTVKAISAVLFEEGRSTVDAKLERLNWFVVRTLERFRELTPLVERVKHPIAKASVLAYFAYDLSLTLVEQKKEK